MRIISVLQNALLLQNASRMACQERIEYRGVGCENVNLDSKDAK